MANPRSDAPEYGTHAPTGLVAALLSVARSMPGWSPTYRLALALQKPILALSKEVVDAESFGCRFRFHPHDNVSERRALVTPCRFDPQECQALLARLPVGGTFIDLGANCGVYTMMMAQQVGPTGTVIALEPQQAVFERLTFNIAANDFAHVRAHQIGVSDQEGVMTLYESDKNRGEATMSISTRMDGNGVDVPVRPLLAVLKDEGISQIDALKIDVEGHEEHAMAPFMDDAPDSLLPSVIVTENSRKHWTRDWVATAINRGFHITSEDRRNIILERPPIA